MRTDQINRLQRILELIDTCEQLIESHNQTLSKTNALAYGWTKTHYEERIRVNNRIIARLQNYFNNTLTSINKF